MTFQFQRDHILNLLVILQNSSYIPKYGSPTPEYTNSHDWTTRLSTLWYLRRTIWQWDSPTQVSRMSPHILFALSYPPRRSSTGQFQHYLMSQLSPTHPSSRRRDGRIADQFLYRTNESIFCNTSASSDRWEYRGMLQTRQPTAILFLWDLQTGNMPSLHRGRPRKHIWTFHS